MFNHFKPTPKKAAAAQPVRKVNLHVKYGYCLGNNPPQEKPAETLSAPPPEKVKPNKEDKQLPAVLPKKRLYTKRPAKNVADSQATEPSANAENNLTMETEVPLNQTTRVDTTNHPHCRGAPFL